MRDLDFNEVRFVYGAGGSGCSPTPPSCGGGGSKSKHSGSKMKHSAKKHSANKGSKGKSCYC